MKDIVVLTVRQPFAWLIVNRIKDIENRSRRTHYRGRIFIQASKSYPDFDLISDLEQRHQIRIPESELALGGIVGYADVVDCVEASHSSWFSGPFGWVLSGANTCPFVHITGQLGLFRIPCPPKLAEYLNECATV